MDDAPAPETRLVLTKAFLRSAQFLALDEPSVAALLELPTITVARMRAGEYLLDPARPSEWPAALQLVQLYESLSVLLGDEEKVRAWLHSDHHVLGARPVELITGAKGLSRVLGYVHSMRGRP